MITGCCQQMLHSPVTVILHVRTILQHRMSLQVHDARMSSGVVLGSPCGPIAAGAVHKADALPEVLPAPLEQQLLHLDVASIHGILRHFPDPASNPILAEQAWCWAGKQARKPEVLRGSCYCRRSHVWMSLMEASSSSTCCWCHSLSTCKG